MGQFVALYKNNQNSQLHSQNHNNLQTQNNPRKTYNGHPPKNKIKNKIKNHKYNF